MGVLSGMDQNQKRRDLGRVLVSQTAGVGAIKFAGAASTFLMTAAISRSLSPGDAGLFFLTLSVFLVFSTLCRGGVEMAVVSRAAAAGVRKINLSSILAVALSRVTKITAWLLALIAFSIAIYLMFAEVNNELLLVAILFMLASVPHAWSVVYAHALQGIGHIKIASAALSMTIPLGVLVGYLLAITLPLPASPELYAGIYAGSCSVTLAIMIIRSKPHLQKPAPLSATDSTHFTAATNKLLASNFLAIFILWWPLILVGIVSTTESAAIYNVAFRCASLLALIMAVVNAVSAPRLADAVANHDYALAARLWRYSCVLSSGLAFPFAVLLFTFGEDILMVFGSHYVAGHSVLLILCGAQICSALTGSSGVFLMMANLEPQLMKITLLAAITSLLLTGILTPIFGIIGAAISVVLTTALQNFMSATVAAKFLRSTQSAVDASKI